MDYDMDNPETSQPVPVPAINNNNAQIDFDDEKVDEAGVGLGDQKDDEDPSKNDDDVKMDQGIEGSSSFNYLERGFSSEKYKIEVQGIPTHFGFSHVKKLLGGKLGIKFHRIKIPPSSRNRHIYVNFANEEDKTRALAVLDGYKLNDKTRLIAMHADPVIDPYVHKSKNKNEKGQNRNRDRVKDKDADAARVDSNKSLNERILDVACPWWNISYDEQIKKKTEFSAKALDTMTKQLHNINPALKTIFPKDNVLESVVQSPITSHYRNKCEFSIGYNSEDKKKTVGFRLASYKDGNVDIGPVDNLPQLIPNLMVRGVSVFQEFVRKADYEPFSPITKKGVWSQFTCRVADDDQILIIVYCNTEELSQDAQIKLKNDLKEHFIENESTIKITSLYFKEIEKLGQKERNIPQNLYGEYYIHQTICGLKFRISPEAFFQVNYQGAEELFKVLRAQCGVDEDTTLLDICCGTGTIGICLAEKVSQVIGVETNLSAVSDAKFNTETNKLEEKCQFYAGKAEDLIDIIIHRSKTKNICAVVDPPRGGLNQKVLLEIRNCKRINRLIFVSCDIMQALRNFNDLTRPSSKKFMGIPFVPTKIIPVDLFPSTPHIEMIVVFDRLTQVNNISSVALKSEPEK